MFWHEKVQTSTKFFAIPRKINFCRSKTKKIFQFSASCLISDFEALFLFLLCAGDNIFAADSTDAAKSLDAAFAPVVRWGIPWSAVLGNHDQESALSREGVMQHIVQMEGTVSQFNPTARGEEMDGYGNYNVEVMGADGSRVHNKSLLNLYFLDSGDYSIVPSVSYYDWIKPSQLLWFQQTSTKLQVCRFIKGSFYG